MKNPAVVDEQHFPWGQADCDGFPCVHFDCLRELSKGPVVLDVVAGRAQPRREEDARLPIDASHNRHSVGSRSTPLSCFQEHAFQRSDGSAAAMTKRLPTIAQGLRASIAVLFFAAPRDQARGGMVGVVGNRLGLAEVGWDTCTQLHHRLLHWAAKVRD